MPHLPWRKTFHYGLVPVFFYFIFFCFYTYPWITHFSTIFFGDAGDGLQNVWNLWWIDKALATHPSIWFTTDLHFPHGTTLLGHTLNPINGLITALLLPSLTLVQTYNLTVTTAFVLTGLTTFWLCYKFSRSYIGSLLGGFAFTFSSYHFAHGIGHMNLITLQWLPLFLLAWWQLLEQPTYRAALCSSLALLAVSLTDFYYLLFAILTAGIMVIYQLLTGRLKLKDPKTLKSFGLFISLSLILVAPLAIAVLRANHLDPFLGAHNPQDYGMNLLSPFIPNQIWHFANLTQWFWQADNLDIVEGSVNLSLMVLLSIAVALVTIKKQSAETRLWLWLLIIFAVLSVGPRLHVMDQLIAGIPMPYSLLARIVPLFKLAGVPVRMMIITLLAGSVIFAIQLAKLKPARPAQVLLLAVIAIVLFFESWPMPMLSTSPQVPSVIKYLRGQPAGGLIDTLDTPTTALYYQTVHHKPMVGGYISRVPASVDQKDQQIMAAFNNRNYRSLHMAYGVIYLLVPADSDLQGLDTPVYRDTQAALYNLSGYK